MPPKVQRTQPSPQQLDEAIMRRIEAKLDRDGLVEAIVDQVASKITDNISVEELVDQIVDQKRESLTAALVGRLLADFAA